MEKNELYFADWDPTRSGYNIGQLSSQGMDFENVRCNVIPTIVFIIHVSNASYRSNIVHSYQILTLDDRTHFLVSPLPLLGGWNTILWHTFHTLCNYQEILVKGTIS